MPHLGQIIVLVDVDSKLDFLQLRSGRSFILGLFGDIVPEFSKVDDLADRRGGRWGDLHQIETKALQLCARRHLAS